MAKTKDPAAETLDKLRDITLAGWIAIVAVAAKAIFGTYIFLIYLVFLALVLHAFVTLRTWRFIFVDMEQSRGKNSGGAVVCLFSSALGGTIFVLTSYLGYLNLEAIANFDPAAKELVVAIIVGVFWYVLQTIINTFILIKTKIKIKI